MPTSLDGTENADSLVIDGEATDVTSTADTSAADQGVEPQSGSASSDDFDPIAVTRRALETTKDAAKDGEGDPPGPVEGEKGEGQPADPANAKDNADQAPSEDEDAKLPFGKHPRFKQVLNERKEALARVADLEPDAQSYREVVSFMDANRLTHEEVQNGFAIMAALKMDPPKALEMLRPYVESLEAFVGNRLPEDLQQRVDEGMLDDESARELARLRSERSHERETAKERQERQATERAERASADRAAVADSFIASQRASDPDFALKAPLLKGQIQAAIQDRLAQRLPIETPEHVQEVMAAAYRTVTESLKRAAPRDKRTGGLTRGVPSAASTSTAAAPLPTDPVALTRHVLAKMRAA